MKDNCSRCNYLFTGDEARVCWHCWVELRVHSSDQRQEISKLKDKIRRRNLQIKELKTKLATYQYCKHGLDKLSCPQCNRQ